jgi:hypothetical protein
MTRKLRIVVAFAFAAALTTVLSGAVAANVTFTDVMVSSFKAPGERGTVALTKQGSGTLTLAVSLVRLTPNSMYRIRFSSNRCSYSVGPNIFDNFVVNSDANGTAFANTTFDDQSALGAKSVRLFHAGNQVDCALAGDYNGNGAVDAADYLTIIDKPGARGIVDLHRTNDPTVDSLTITFSSLQAGGDYVLVASKAPCGTAQHSGDRILSWSFGAAAGWFYSRTQVTHDPTFEDWASTRVFRGGQQVACGRVIKSFAT